MISLFFEEHTKMKDYAREISKDLNIDYDKVLKMTLTEVLSESQKKYESIIDARVQDKTRNRYLEILMPHYDFFKEKLGNYLIHAFAKFDDDAFIEWSEYGDSNIDYETEENSRLLLKIRDAECKYKWNNNYNSSKYKLRIRQFRYVSKLLEEAINQKYPQLIKYCPEIYEYRYEYLDAEISFLIWQTKVIKDGEEGIEENRFTCTLQSFLEMDIEMMIDDYLEITGFYLCNDKNDSKYKTINKRLSSKKFAEFTELLRQL